MNKIILTLIIFSLLTLGLVFAVQPKPYDTVKKTGVAYTGESCECLGLKNENTKLCKGLVYNCLRVK